MEVAVLRRVRTIMRSEGGSAMEVSEGGLGTGEDSSDGVTPNGGGGSR